MPAGNKRNFMIFVGIGVLLLIGWIAVDFYYQTYLPSFAKARLLALKEVQYRTEYALELYHEMKGNEEILNKALLESDPDVRAESVGSIASIRNLEYEYWKGIDKPLKSWVQDWRDNLISRRDGEIKTPQSAMGWAYEMRELARVTKDDIMYERGGSLAEDMKPLVDRLSSDQDFLRAFLMAFERKYYWGLTTMALDDHLDNLPVLLATRDRFPGLPESLDVSEELRDLYKAHGVIEVLPQFNLYRYAGIEALARREKFPDRQNWREFLEDVQRVSGRPVYIHKSARFVTSRPEETGADDVPIRPHIEAVLGNDGPLIVFLPDRVFILPAAHRDRLYTRRRMSGGPVILEERFLDVSFLWYLVDWSRKHADEWPTEFHLPVQLTCRLLDIEEPASPERAALEQAIDQTFRPINQYFSD